MKITRLLIVVGLLAALFGALPVSAATPSVSVGVYSIAACRDTATVAIQGSSTYSNNRLDVNIFYKNDKGQYVLLKQAYSAVFAAGPFMTAVTLPYADKAAAAGEVLRIDVQLQRLSGGSYVNAGSLVTKSATVADKYCIDKCSVTVDTSDKAPASGTLTLRSHFGSWFRPEGRLHGAIPVSSGQKARVVFAGLPCNWPARVWYYPKTGDKTPRMLPAQYWPNDFQANSLDGTNPYVTSFASGLKPTHPLEPGDPFVAK